jgi:hypothetical protein
MYKFKKEYVSFIMPKTKLQKFISGFKEGLNLNSLPDHILKIENNFYVKIFKILGAFVFFYLLAKFHINSLE